MIEFNFKTKPFDHQRKAFRLAVEALTSTSFFALLMDQRTGKTKVALDVSAYYYQQGKIKTLLVIVWPNGGQRVWRDEAESHTAVPYEIIVWDSGASLGVRWQREADQKLLTQKLLVCVVNAEGTITPRCKELLKRVIKRGPYLCFYDESTSIGEPGSARSKVAHSLGRTAAFRMIGTGTPVDGGPLKLYSQFRFLKHGSLGFTSYLAFKNRYAEWEERFDGPTDKPYKALVGYRNVEELKEKLARHSFRVRKEECFDLPPKVFQKRFFKLSREQAKIYVELEEQFRAELAGGTVTAAHVLTRYTRLQQVASGFVVLDRGAELCPACQGDGCDACSELGWVGQKVKIERFKSNPRLEALLTEVENIAGQFVVWCRFTLDVEAVIEALNRVELPDHGKLYAVRFDGRLTPKQREANMNAYKSGEARAIVAQTQAMARAYDLAANTTDMIYYTNMFGLEVRRQSQDRADGPKRKVAQGIVDLVAEGTVDERIVDALRAGKNLADEITGDPKGEWI